MENMATAVTALKWKNIRAVRDANLAASDFTQLADAPFDDETKANWAKTRQLWRDIPQTYTADLTTIAWPSHPSVILDVKEGVQYGRRSPDA